MERSAPSLPLLACAALLLVAAGPWPGPGPAGRLFTDVTERAGLRYLQYALPLDPDCEVEVLACQLAPMSGGAAVADVDGDGWTDLFVTRLDRPDLLFRNRGDGRFEDVTAAAGLAGFDLQSNGATFADIDNDGDPDLFVTLISFGDDGVNDRNYLFVNDGHGHFTEQAVARGAAVASQRPRITFSAGVGDFDRDGWVDLHVPEWIVSDHSRLLRNRGAEAPGHFEDWTEQAGLVLDGVDGFASAFVDLDGDGWQDLAHAADFGTSRLFWNRGDGSFEDGTVAAGVGTDENGMGSTFGDFDADGLIDWFVTSIFDADETCDVENCNWGYTGNRLYRNEGGRVFSDATDAAGVREGFWGWGTAFFDFDNDRDQDLVMTNGISFVFTDIDDAFNDDPMRLWRNDGSGRMSEISAHAGMDDTGSGKGLLTFDYDRDGDLDVFVVNTAGEPRLYRNDARRRNRWLRLRVVGSESNRDGLGAKVSLWRRPGEAPQVREVGAATHFLGQSESILHFGLGPGRPWVYKLRVEFPASGRIVERHRLRANRRYTLGEDGELREDGGRGAGRRCGRFGGEAWLALAPLAWVAGRTSRTRRR